MRPKTELEQSMRDAFPIVFRKSESVDQSAFSQKYDDLIDYATAVSEPFLRPETIRYQSILLYVTLVFISLHLFKIGSVRLREAIIEVDQRLLVIYTIFIGLIVTIFLIKAYVDSQRSRFSRNKNAEVVYEMQTLLNAGFLKERIQMFCWLDLCASIERSYSCYCDATMQTPGSATGVGHLLMNAFKVDLNELRRIPELSTEVEKKEEFLASLKRELASDTEKFRSEAQAILKEVNAAPQGTFDADTKLETAFDQFLRDWCDAKRTLVIEMGDLRLKELQDAAPTEWNATARILNRITNIRRIYAAIEVIAPVVFAVFAIVYVWML